MRIVICIALMLFIKREFIDTEHLKHGEAISRDSCFVRLSDLVLQGISNRSNHHANTVRLSAPLSFHPLVCFCERYRLGLR